MTRLQILTTLLLIVAATTFASNTGNFKIMLATGEFTPTQNIREVRLDEFRAEENVINGRFYAIIQFYSIPLQESKNMYESREWHFLEYIPNNAYIVSLPVSVTIDELVNAGVRSLLRIDASMRMHPDLLSGFYPQHCLPDNTHIDLLVSFNNDLNADDLAALIVTNNIPVMSSFIGINNRIVRLLRDDIKHLASFPFISWIEPVPPDPEPENYTGKTLHRSNMISTMYAGGRKYDGTGVDIMLQDDGYIGPHIDYQGRIGSQNITTNSTSMHGDHCAGIIMGYGNLDPRTTGNASGATIHTWGASPTYPGFAAISTAYPGKNIRISSTSYSDGCNDGYTTLTKTLDKQILDYPSLMHVFSAGNNGTSNCGYGAGSGWGNITGGHKMAKNTIAVANLNASDGLSSSSSRGPAHDGRIKPDISAKGTDVYATQENNTYDFKTGTSMSCPGVSGTLAQLYHAYRELNGGQDPKGGLMKALILNTADDIYNPGPDFKTGYGRINALRAVKVLENHYHITDTITQGDTNIHTITIPAGTSQVRVMVLWSDKESFQGTTRALVNNLNMQLIDPAQLAWNPWVLNHLPNAATLDAPAVRAIDSINNMEQVTIDNPAPGAYAVVVKGTAVPQGPQEYYIIYEFVADDITLVYPNGGEGLVPGESEMLRWDAYGNSGNFTLEYSENAGLTWSAITTVPGNARFTNWNVPQVLTDRALVRISRNTKQDVSDALFSIMRVPSNLNIEWACRDSFMLVWDSVPGIENYEVSMLGAKYMDSVGVTSDNQFVIDGVYYTQETWVSVRSVGTSGGKGRRAIAVYKGPVTWNCTFPYDVGISVISPSTGYHHTCINQTNIPVKVKLENKGFMAASGFEVKYNVNGFNNVTETYNDTIPPGGSVIYTFAQTISFPLAGQYGINASITYSLDSNLYNDYSISRVSLISEPAVTPDTLYTFDAFSECSTASNCQDIDCGLGSGWKNEPNNLTDSIDWRPLRGVTPTSGTGPIGDHTTNGGNGIFLYLEASGDCFEQLAKIVSPCIDLTNTSDPVLEFWYNMNGANIGSLHLDAMTGHEWIEDIIPPISGNQGAGWLRKVADLSAYSGKMVSIRFRGYTGSGNLSDLAIDDITIATASAIREIHQMSEMLVYPNPSSGQFNLQFSDLKKPEMNITVFDLSGKTVFTGLHKIENQNGFISIDLSSLPKGMYMIQASSGDRVYHDKIGIH